MADVPREEYPRPQFVRDSWVNLNGEWEFSFDDDNVGEAEKWYASERPFPQTIQVPFAFQSKLSGIGDPSVHDIVWYRKKVTLPNHFHGQKVILHFGAVDYSASVWVNGRLVVRHEGGHTPFEADITGALDWAGENRLVVRVEDFSRDVTLPRGKQYWKDQSESIFYTRTTGIWQTVWLEAVPHTRLARVRYTPDIDKDQIGIQAFIEGAIEGQELSLRTRIHFEGQLVAEEESRVVSSPMSRQIRLNAVRNPQRACHWSPEHPNLYDVEYTLISGEQTLDEVRSYFGMRHVEIKDGRFYLNHRPYKLRMVLDQGYFPDGNLTPPSDDAVKRDVELTRAMGFNGARKHQKVEDPRYMYWCDKLGLIVWGEMANAYQYSENYAERMSKEWLEVLRRDYNHPCIVAWVPLNESWGVPDIDFNPQQQQHALAMYHLTKSLDPTRLVVSNDGWELVTTDICSIHDYEWRRDVLAERYATTEGAVSATPANRDIYARGFTHNPEVPVMVTEFGGIAYKKSDWDGWGYSGAENDEDFLERLNNVVEPLRLADPVQGFCYTQLTDVEQEINGLLTYDREPKVPLEKIKEIMTGKKD